MGVRIVLIAVLCLLANAAPSADLVAPLPAGIASSGETDGWCLRCHGMATLAVRRTDGTIRDLAVDSIAFRESNHRRLHCIACHTTGATRYPHDRDIAIASECGACHQRTDHPLVARDSGMITHFAEIRAEFTSSIHFDRREDAFACFTCHDPHVFRKSGDPSILTIGAQNGVCLDCHEDGDRFRAIARKDPPDLDSAHVWLPAQDLHRTHVRCLDCHTSYRAPNRSHRILRGSSAVRRCEDCHQRNSILLGKLYRVRRGAETERRGFLNAALFNDSYVIGATRNRWLDLAGLMAVGVAVAGVVGHGLARRVVRRQHDR